MTQWSRRRFVRGLGLATLATACKRAPSTARTEETGTAPHRPEPRTPGARELLDPGFFSMGRAPLAFDGDELLEVRAGILIRRDASLAEVSRLPIEGVASFAVVRDRSLVVLVKTKTGGSVHHVVAGKVEATHSSFADLVLPTASPTSYWAVQANYVARTQLANGKIDFDVQLPGNRYADTAQVTSDGSLVISSLEGILHVDRELVTYAWNDAPKHLGPGPDATSVWASLTGSHGGPPKLALLKLDGDRATATATHPLAPAEHFVHVTSHGAHAAAIVARTLAPYRAAFSLVVFDVNGERWRAPLVEGSEGYFAVLSPTRVVVFETRSNALRAFDLATGKPA